MKKTSLNRTNLLLAFGLLAAGILVGWFIKPTPSPELPPAATAETGKPTIWTCSMDPQVRQHEPGKCPICGMDLIPLDEGNADGDPLEVKMSPTAMQLASVQTAVVGYGMPARELRLTGKVATDERLVYSQVSHLSGRVEQLAVNFTGETVRKGQTLATLYAPELVTAQEELFAALKIKDMQPGLFQAAREKLKNWKLTEAQIDQILADGKPRERFPILADVGGIVLNKRVNLGDYLMRGMPLYDIADLSRVWVLFDVHESDMPWIRVGSTLSFTVASLPGETFQGRVAFIDPVINPATRVATARVEMANPGARLKPEMFASGIVKTQMSGNKKDLMAPKSAVLWTGERSVVYKKTTNGQGVNFTLQLVTLGPLAGDGYVVRSGLQPGDEIAVSGAFSIDAAAQLAGKPSMMNPDGGAPPAGHQHGAPSTPSAGASPKAKDAVQRLFAPYYSLKDALVKTDFAAAQKQAGALRRAFEQTDMGLFKGAAHDHWMANSGQALSLLKKMAAAGDIEAVRREFKPLSARMVALAREFGPFGETIYVQHCPMADEDSGADWLSSEREVRNPYFGDKMMKCGQVTETIK